MKISPGLARSVRVSPTPQDPFRPVLRSPDPQQDSELAELIEQDGRDRLDRNLPCGLDRYYGAVPDLLAKPIALDAAIDISLRSLAQSDGSLAPEEKHTEVLLRSYPELAGPIRLAALLHNQTVTTSGTGSLPHRRRSFPCRIGAPLEDNKPRYELLRPLGRGRSGTVCEAIDHLLSDAGHAAKVAVKLIPVDPTTAQRQTAEATKARRVEHPGVVRVLDRGLTDAEELYLVYELVPGGDLEAWFHERGRRIAPEEGASIVAGIAAGVQAAHSAGLVHCDLKPQNVLMDPTGQPRVSDFGVSAMTEAFPGMDNDGAGVPMGNLAFAAPEQIRRSAMYASPLVDVYALGGILYYLLSGRLPNGNTPEEVARNHHPTEGRQVAPSVRAVNSACDPRLDRICARALAPRPEHRYTTAAELAADLTAWLERRPIAWMRESWGRRVELWTRRSPVAAGMAVVASLAVILGAAGTGFFAQSASTERAVKEAINRTMGEMQAADARVFTKIFESEEGKRMTDQERVMEMFREYAKVHRSPFAPAMPSWMLRQQSPANPDGSPVPQTPSGTGVPPSP